MIRIRVKYDDDREIAEVIRLLSSRLNYCRKAQGNESKVAYLGIETSDLLAVSAAENADEARESADFPGDTPIDCTKGGKNDECDR